MDQCVVLSGGARHELCTCNFATGATEREREREYTCDDDYLCCKAAASARCNVTLELKIQIFYAQVLVASVNFKRRNLI